MTPTDHGNAGEQRRWVIVLGVPFALACASFAAAIAASTELLFLPAILLAPAWITLLAFLALSSDTNETSAELVELPRRLPDTARRAA
jgi:hypothetical protein